MAEQKVVIRLKYMQMCGGCGANRVPNHWQGVMIWGTHPDVRNWGVTDANKDMVIEQAYAKFIPLGFTKQEIVFIEA